MAYPNYTYGAYPAPGGYYSPPMPDQLAQLRGAQMPPMQQPMMGQPMQGAQMQQPQPVIQNGQPQTYPNGSNMIWVTRKEAEDFLVGANCSVSLWDKDENVAYIKSADSTGRPTMRILDYTERTSTLRTPVQSTPQQAQEAEYVTKADFNELAARADALTAEIEALKKRKCACREKAQKDTAND